jgi:4-alpha-glucanotransferase
VLPAGDGPQPIDRGMDRDDVPAPRGLAGACAGAEVVVSEDAVAIEHDEIAAGEGEEPDGNCGERDRRRPALFARLRIEDPHVACRCHDAEPAPALRQRDGLRPRELERAIRLEIPPATAAALEPRGDDRPRDAGVGRARRLGPCVEDAPTGGYVEDRDGSVFRDHQEEVPVLRQLRLAERSTRVDDGDAAMVAPHADASAVDREAPRAESRHCGDRTERSLAVRVEAAVSAGDLDAAPRPDGGARRIGRVVPGAGDGLEAREREAVDAPQRDRRDLGTVDRQEQVHDAGAPLRREAGDEHAVRRAQHGEAGLAGRDHHGAIAREPCELRGHRQAVERERLHGAEIGEPRLALVVHREEALSAQIELDRGPREAAPDPPLVVREVPDPQQTVDRDGGQAAPVRIQRHAADRSHAAARAFALLLELLVPVVRPVERDGSLIVADREGHRPSDERRRPDRRAPVAEEKVRARLTAPLHRDHAPFVGGQRHGADGVVRRGGDRPVVHVRTELIGERRHRFRLYIGAPPRYFVAFPIRFCDHRWAMRPISLVLLLVDAHTPGESPAVIQHTVTSVLRPLVGLLERYQQVRVSLALSGATAEWLEGEDAELVERLRGLIARKQLEPVAVAHYGAVLHTLPFRDAVDQVQRNVVWLKRVLGARARGMWLSGGAWDGIVPRVLSRAGLHYAFCDDALVRAARDTGESALGWYVAEREAGAVGIIPLDRRLAEFVPWSEPTVVAAELQNRARSGDRILAVEVPLTDLGLRPDLHARFWDPAKGYALRLSKMLTGQSSWLKTQLGKEVLKDTRPNGRVVPLAGTSLESGIGALPVEQASRLQKLQEIVDRGDDPVLHDAAPWLVGPPFEAFLGRYVEANRVHKHALRSSVRLDHARRKHKQAHDVLDHLAMRLSQAQSAFAIADAPSGGIYRGDLRHAAWSRIAEVDRALDELDGALDALTHKAADFDCDGVPEVAVATPTFGAVVTPAQGGALTELLVWGVGNVCNAFTRYPELWHDDLARWSSMPMIVGSHASEDHEAEVVVDDDAEIESTDELSRHPIQAVAQMAPVRPRLPAIVPGLDRLIVHDHVPRASLIDHFFGEPLTLENLQRDQYPEIGDFAREPYQLQAAEDVSINEMRVSVAREGTVRQGDQRRLVRVYKQYRFYKDLPEIDVEVVVSNRYHEPVRATFGLQVNLNLDSVRGPSRFLVVPGRERIFLDAMGEIADATSVALVLADRGLQLTLEAQPAGARIFYYPIETPLRTWRGYANAFQGTCVLLTWKLELWGQEKQTFGLRLKADRR